MPRTAAALWDEKRGIRGGFSASLRELVMKLRQQNISPSRISNVISLFVEHFELDIDVSRLPSVRQIGRIANEELSIICNAQLGHAIGVSSSDVFVHGHDASTKLNRKLGTLHSMGL